MHPTRLPAVSARLVLSHSSILSAGSKVAAVRAPVRGAEPGPGTPLPTESLGARRVDAAARPRAHPSNSPPGELAALTQPGWLQGPSPSPLRDGRLSPARDKPAVALGDVWVLMTTALPTFIPTQTRQEPESGLKRGRKKTRKKKKYGKIT